MTADLHIWEATNDPGEPTCVVGNREDSGYSLTLYRDERGSIVGGLAATPEGYIETAFGLIHAGEYLAAREA